MNAGVIINDWALATFKKVLDEAGFTYSYIEGPEKHSITLQVETENPEELTPVIKQARDEATRKRLH